MGYQTRRELPITELYDLDSDIGRLHLRIAEGPAREMDRRREREQPLAPLPEPTSDSNARQSSDQESPPPPPQTERG